MSQARNGRAPEDVLTGLRIPAIGQALSVGDRMFRKKSTERIEELLENAGTLMFVSHSPAEITRQCNRALWIEKGVLRADGSVDEVIEAYNSYTP